MNRPTYALALATVLFLSGCSNESSSMGGLSRGDSGSLDGRNAKFESSEDPPIAARTQYAAGQLAESQGKVDQAAERYRAALKADPRHLPSLYRLGVLHSKSGQYPQAIETWKAYVSLTGSNAAAYSNLALCHELAGEPAAAEAAYRQGVAADPKNNPCRVNYGLMLARAGRVNEAVIQWQAVLAPAQVHYNLGSVYEQSGRRDQAKAEYRKAAELDPTMSEAEQRLAALGE